MASGYPGFEDYTRVSTVADAISRMEGDGLVYAGATMAGKRAVEITQEVFAGRRSQDVEAILGAIGSNDPKDYLATDHFKDHVIGGATRYMQAAADRGTVLNAAFDALVSGAEGIRSLNDFSDFAAAHIDDYNETASLRWAQYKDAKSQGLIETGSEKPEYPYRCSIYDLSPFLASLWNWHERSGDALQVQKFQTRHHCDQTKVIGTTDYEGLWGGVSAVIDLKSSTSPNVSRYYRAQAAAYKRLCGAELAVILIVNPDKTSPRVMSNEGYVAGLADFDNALAIIQRKGIAGSFAPASASMPKEKVSA